MGVQMGKVQRMAWRIYFKVAPYMPSATPATLIDRVLNRVLGTDNVLGREDALALHEAVLRVSAKQSNIPAMAGGSVLDADQAPLAPQHLVDPGEPLQTGDLPYRAIRWAGGGIDRFTPFLDVARSTPWYVNRFKLALGAAMVTGPNTPIGYAAKQRGMDVALAGLPEGARVSIMDADQAPLAPQHFGFPQGAKMVTGPNTVVEDAQLGGESSIFDASHPRFEISPRVLGNRAFRGAKMVTGPNTAGEPGRVRFQITPRELGNRPSAARKEWLNFGSTWFLYSPIAVVRMLIADVRNLFRRSS